MIQIGCTEYVTYLLADGILYVSGSNDDGSAGIGHKENVLAPSPIDFGGRKWVMLWEFIGLFCFERC